MVWRYLLSDHFWILGALYQFGSVFGCRLALGFGSLLHAARSVSSDQFLVSTRFVFPVLVPNGAPAVEEPVAAPAAPEAKTPRKSKHNTKSKPRAGRKKKR